jgi:hypothetical protein
MGLPTEWTTYQCPLLRVDSPLCAAPTGPGEATGEMSSLGAETVGSVYAYKVSHLWGMWARATVHCTAVGTSIRRNKEQATHQRRGQGWKHIDSAIIMVHE